MHRYPHAYALQAAALASARCGISATASADATAASDSTSAGDANRTLDADITNARAAVDAFDPLGGDAGDPTTPDPTGAKLLSYVEAEHREILGENPPMPPFDPTPFVMRIAYRGGSDDWDTWTDAHVTFAAQVRHQQTWGTVWSAGRNESGVAVVLPVAYWRSPEP